MHIPKLHGLVRSILGRAPSSRIVVIGDFNEFRAEITTTMEAFGLKAILEEGVKTHSAGGHLDQFFSNLECDSVTAADAPFTDHCLFSLKLILRKNRNDIDIRNLPTQFT